MRNRDYNRAVRQYYTQPDPFEPPDDVLAAVESLFDVGRESLCSHDESFDHCLMCDHVDGHDDGCPIPVLKAWRVQFD